MESRVVLLVPRIHVKVAKSALEERDLLDRNVKIVTHPTQHQESPESPRARIQTTLTVPTSGGTSFEDSVGQYPQSQKAKLIADLGLGDLGEVIEISTLHSLATKTPVSGSHNPVIKALGEALRALPQPLLDFLDLTTVDLVKSFPTTYSVYKPLLLLPSHAFNSPPWAKFLAAHAADSNDVRPIWAKLAAAVGATHVAINARIPLSTQATRTDTLETESDENILRSPADLSPIHGDFGPRPDVQRLSNPTEQDFASSLWVSTCQNGIHQVWAPLYTMFSRGNIREKSRLLTLPCVLSVKGDAAADLYAGIGYFAFSYRKAGISRILCWELNPWSVEGLRRGAELNGWPCKITKILPNDEAEWQDWYREAQSAEFLVFQQSNEEATSTLQRVGRLFPDLVPRVRNVNCGLLPSSRLSWHTAVRILDPDLGGWIHVHENVGVGDIDGRGAGIADEMRGLVDALDEEKGCGGKRNVVLEHVERVKTFAPGVVHVVFDIAIGAAADHAIGR